MSDTPMAAVLAYYGFDLSRVPANGWRTIKCQFHSDSRASARVSLEDGGFICNACGVQGDALKLIQGQEGFSSRGEARKFAEEKLGTSVPEVRRPAGSGASGKRRPWRTSLS